MSDLDHPSSRPTERRIGRQILEVLQGWHEHDFRPVAGHPDDDECTYRTDGTDETYCGMTREQHRRPDRPAQPTVQPSIEEVARALFLQRYPESGGWNGPGWEKRRAPWLVRAEAILALIGGRTEAEVLAQGWDEGFEAGATTEDVLYLPLERCAKRSCSKRHYSELTDDENTHWHAKSSAHLTSLAAHDAEVKAEALGEAAYEAVSSAEWTESNFAPGPNSTAAVAEYRERAAWLRDRAAAIRAGER